MDDAEGAFRERELKLEEDKLAYARANDHNQRRTTIWTVAVSTTLSVLAVAASVLFSVRQLADNQDQFERTSRAEYYANIVDGLGGSSVAVQTNAMLLLVQFVEDRRNYGGDAKLQRDGGRDAIQVLGSFIEDLSTPTSKGLPDYRSPEPVIVSRAMTQLKKLASNPALGSHTTDISRANLHGISLPYFSPRGPLLAVAADFRRANLYALKLHAGQNSLQRSFLTCANLAKSDLGDADLKYADLSGADLRGANLAHTKNLGPAQIVGIRTDRQTILPSGLQALPRPWISTSQKCIDEVNWMTGMMAGQGYDKAFPCPLDNQSWARTEVSRRFSGDVNDLVRVCAARRVPAAPANPTASGR
jgi:hypothetical protein